jgi:hypothetical protein
MPEEAMMTLQEEGPPEAPQESPMVAIEQSRRAAERLWGEICRLLAAEQSY